MKKEIKDEIFKNYGINENTYSMLFSDKENLNEEECGSIENLLAYLTIDKFTMIQEKKIILKLLKIIYKNKLDVNKISFNKETNSYEYRDLEKNFVFSKLSNRIDNNKLKRELMSKKRYKKCHSRSLGLSLNIKNSRVLTGYITLGNAKYIHSVVEYEFNDEVIILDWTRNLKILKKDYLELTKFEELSIVSSNEIKDDIEIIANNLEIGIKPYLVFRDEIIRDLSKNYQLFQDDSKEK